MRFEFHEWRNWFSLGLLARLAYWAFGWYRHLREKGVSLVITADFGSVGIGATTDVIFGPLARGDTFKGITATVVDLGGTVFAANDTVEVALSPNRSFEGGSRMSKPMPIPKAIGQSVTVPCQERLTGRVFVLVRLSGGTTAFGVNVAAVVERRGQSDKSSGVPVVAGVGPSSPSSS